MVGEQIGPYQILKMLGQGGMGIVYQGMHTRLEQLVAVKVLSPEFSENSTMRERFVQEAKLQVKLSHPNVVNILNYLEDNRNIYLIMEYVQGETLEARLQRLGALPVAECCRITVAVLEALAFMHRQGIIHRDIKPSNIMLTDLDQIKVTDFGIAKATGEKGLTKTGTQLGTVWYMSPEQIRGAQVDAASDIYALGITLFQMATGEVPFHNESDFEIMKAHVEQPPPDPEALNPLIQPMLADIIRKALAKERSDRYGSADEFKNALVFVEQQSRAVHSASSGSTMQGASSADIVAGAAAVDVVSFDQGAGERLIFGRFERRPFFMLVALAFILLMLLIYLLSASELFKQNIKEKPHPIPLTSVNPEPSETPSRTDSGRPEQEEPTLEKSPQEGIEKAESPSEPVKEPEASPPISPENQTQTIASTSEEDKTAAESIEQPLELVAVENEKSPKQIFDEMFGGGTLPQIDEESSENLLTKPHDITLEDLTGGEKEGQELTPDQKEKAPTSKKKSTRTVRTRKKSTKSRAKQTAKGSSSGSKSTKGESKGWVIIK